MDVSDASIAAAPALAEAPTDEREAGGSSSSGAVTGFSPRCGITITTEEAFPPTPVLALDEASAVSARATRLCSNGGDVSCGGLVHHLVRERRTSSESSSASASACAATALSSVAASPPPSPAYARRVDDAARQLGDVLAPATERKSASARKRSLDL